MAARLVRIGGWVWLAVLLAVGTWVMTWRGLVTFKGDCIRPENGNCYILGHPYVGVGVLVWVGGFLGAMIFWLAAARLDLGD